MGEHLDRKFAYQATRRNNSDASETCSALTELIFPLTGGEWSRIENERNLEFGVTYSYAKALHSWGAHHVNEVSVRHIYITVIFKQLFAVNVLDPYIDV